MSHKNRRHGREAWVTTQFVTLHLGSDGSHIQRIGCQPEKTTLHGGQSRSGSAEKYNGGFLLDINYTVDPMLLPSWSHEELLYLQSMIPPKRFDIPPPDRGMLRRSRRVQIFLLKRRRMHIEERMMIERRAAASVKKAILLV